MGLKILHIFDHSVPIQSGYAFRSLAILLELAKLGHTTSHVTSVSQESTQNSIDQSAGFRFVRTNAPTGLVAKLPVVNDLVANWTLKKQVFREVEQFEPDAVHIHSPVLNIINIGSVLRRRGVPVVYEMRSLWEDSAVEKGLGKMGSLKYRLSKGLETYALKHSTDHIITISAGLKQDLISRGVDAQKISIARNGVDLSKFSYNDNIERPTQAMVYGYIGSLHKYEGLELLLKAFSKLNKQFPDTRLIIIGEGDAKESLQLLSQQLNLGSVLTFTGEVPHSEISNYMGHVDTLVYPRLSSRLTEIVTPLKPLEAMAQGLLVVASDIGGHRELVSDKETGMLFEAGSADSLFDTLLSLNQRETENIEMKRRARAFIESERQWLHCAESISKVYEAVVPVR